MSKYPHEQPFNVKARPNQKKNSELKNTGRIIPKKKG